jgi:hypothetical protein
VAGKPAAIVDPIELLSCLFLVVYGEITHCRIHAAKTAVLAQTGGDSASVAYRAVYCRHRRQCDRAGPLAAVGPQSNIFVAMLCRFAGRASAAAGLWASASAKERDMWPRLDGRGQYSTGRVGTGVDRFAEGRRGGKSQAAIQYSARVSARPPSKVQSRPPVELPAAEVARIRDHLSSATITIESVSGLANAAIVVRFPAELADVAADAIARADYRLPHDNKAVFIAHLRGLASAAAIARSSKLADALFLLVRTYRHFHPDELTIEDGFRIAIIACASRLELADWCKCLGDLMIDCAFRPITVEEATRLHSHLVHLCHLVPELWSSCGQAEAALRSVLMS